MGCVGLTIPSDSGDDANDGEVSAIVEAVYVHFGMALCEAPSAHALGAAEAIGLVDVTISADGGSARASVAA